MDALRISDRMTISAVIGLLREEHGDAKASGLARAQQHKARRARSRKRFNFWREIALRLENGAEQAPKSNAEGDLTT
jgi:hypothetical protein